MKKKQTSIKKMINAFIASNFLVVVGIINCVYQDKIVIISLVLLCIFLFLQSIQGRFEAQLQVAGFGIVDASWIKQRLWFGW